MRTVPRLLVAIVVVTMFVMVTETLARAAETILYDVTTSHFAFHASLQPLLISTTERIQITDRGPQTDGSPRWTTESLGQVAIWDEPGSGSSSSELQLFGNQCADVRDLWGAPLSQRNQVSAALGGGDFAWLPGPGPTTTDPYASFCLKWSHQSTTAWTEQVSIGRRVYATPPPLKVFITQPKAGLTVSGTVWVVLWVEGTSGASNVFTLSADGKQIGSPTTSSRGGPVTIPWPTKPVGTTPVPNGTHTLTGTVRDATGNTGTTSITVILNN